ncbi:MAG: hypothetical protein ACTTH7_00500 [Treponema sp.]
MEKDSIPPPPPPPTYRLLKYTVHLIRYCTQITPQRIRTALLVVSIPLLKTVLDISKYP